MNLADLSECLVGVELSSDGGGEEGALVLEAVPGAAALLERQVSVEKGCNSIDLENVRV